VTLLPLPVGQPVARAGRWQLEATLLLVPLILAVIYLPAGQATTSTPDPATTGPATTGPATTGPLVSSGPSGLTTATTTVASPSVTAAATTTNAASLGPAESCDREPRLRSTGAKTAIKITITNSGRSTLELFWLNYKGERVSYGSIPAGSTVVQPTYRDHPWLLTDQVTNRCVSLIADPQDGQEITVG
jgi:VHL beta domain